MATYFENISMNPDPVIVGQSSTLTITGGAPNTAIVFSGASSGTGMLDNNGNYINTSVFVPDSVQPVNLSATYSYDFAFAGTGNVISFSFTASRISVLPMLDQPITFGISRYVTSDDGFTDSSKVIVKVADADSDFLPDNPYAFEDLVGILSVDVTESTMGNIPITSVVNSNGGKYYGRTNLTAQWQHVAESNQRIDPAMINVIDLFILSSNYDTEFRRWIKNDGTAANKPSPMTTVALSQQFADLDLVKTSSDTIIFRPAKYKLLFGILSDTALQAKFKVIKMAGTSLTDNEIKTRIITAIDGFFDITNWSFGETFYFTELAAYIHTRMSGSISSIVIVPSTGDGAFGNLFQVTANADELFVSCATVADVEIINQITKTNIRIG